MANLFVYEVPLSQFRDSFPDTETVGPTPFIPEEDRKVIQQITGGAGEVMNRLHDGGDPDPGSLDEAAYPFLLGLIPFAERYFPGQVTY